MLIMVLTKIEVQEYACVCSLRDMLYNPCYFHDVVQLMVMKQVMPPTEVASSGFQRHFSL